MINGVKIWISICIVIFCILRWCRNKWKWIIKKEIIILYSSFLREINIKLIVVCVNENVLVIVVVIVNLKVIRFDVLFISFFFLSSWRIFFGIFIFFDNVLIVIILVGERMVVSLKVVVSGILGII